MKYMDAGGVQLMVKSLNLGRMGDCELNSAKNVGISAFENLGDTFLKY